MKVETFDSVWDALADTEQEAASLKARSALLYEIRKVVMSWELSPESAAAHLRLTPARLDDLLQGRLTAFSLDELVDISASAQLSVEIRIKGAA